MLSETFIHALLSGGFAALASVFGKIAFSDESIVIGHVNKETVDEFLWNWSNYLHFPVVYLIRALFLGLFILSNILMWLYLSKAMSTSQSTVEVIAVNNAANIMLSVAVGFFYFGERVTLATSIGIAFMVIGVTLINLYSDQAKHRKKVD